MRLSRGLVGRLLATLGLLAVLDIAPAEASPGLRTLLDDPAVASRNPAKRAEAWLAVQRRARVVDLPLLHKTVREHERSHARRLAAEVAGGLRRPVSVPVLAKALQTDRSGHVRRAAAHALGLLGARAGVAPLRGALLKDGEANVRKRAAASLGRILGAEAREIMQEALAKETDTTVRVVLEWVQDWPGLTSVAPQVRRGEVAAGTCRGTRYLVYVPRTRSLEKPMPVLVSVHGSDGRPRPYLDFCKADADAHRTVIVAPWFDFGTFDHWGSWGTRHLGLGRADLRLLEILDDVAKRVPIEKERVLMYGHSQGGQFVHRFVLTHPDRVQRAVAAAPGAIVLPKGGVGFPDGTLANPRFPDLARLDYGALVRSRLTVIVGEHDDAAHHDVARRLYKQCQSYATRHRERSRVRHAVIPGARHSGRENYVRGGRDYVFE